MRTKILRLLKKTGTILMAGYCIISILFYSTRPALTLPNTAVKSVDPLPETLRDRDRVSLVRDVNFSKHFQDLKVTGSILIADRDRTYQYNPQRNETAFLPASTFKILNALISLETKVIPDELVVLTWDGIDRKMPEWNRDLNLREAMKLSAVWFYQVLARRVGHEQMQKWVTQVGYGNHQIGAKEDIDNFWLRGKLRITALDQIQFLRRLYNSNLPFSKRSVAIVKDITIVEQTPDYTIHGKTGFTGFDDSIKPQIGWYVGYIEKGKNVYFFATNLDIRTQTDLAARKELTRRCLRDIGIL
jgi:beta-lactamase class D